MNARVQKGKAVGESLHIKIERALCHCSTYNMPNRHAIKCPTNGNMEKIRELFDALAATIERLREELSDSQLKWSLAIDEIHARKATRRARDEQVREACVNRVFYAKIVPGETWLMLMNRINAEICALDLDALAAQGDR